MSSRYPTPSHLARTGHFAGNSDSRDDVVSRKVFSVVRSSFKSPSYGRSVINTPYCRPTIRGSNTPTKPYSSVRAPPTAQAIGNACHVLRRDGRLMAVRPMLSSVHLNLTMSVGPPKRQPPAVAMGTSKRGKPATTAIPKMVMRARRV